MTKLRISEIELCRLITIPFHIINSKARIADERLQDGTVYMSLALNTCHVCPQEPILH
jgi:hypothetical protein